MTRDPRYALNQELEAKQTLLDQLRALAAEDPDFFIDLMRPRRSHGSRLNRASVSSLTSRCP